MLLNGLNYIKRMTNEEFASQFSESDVTRIGATVWYLYNAGEPEDSIKIDENVMLSQDECMFVVYGKLMKDCIWIGRKALGNKQYGLYCRVPRILNGGDWCILEYDLGPIHTDRLPIIEEIVLNECHKHKVWVRVGRICHMATVNGSSIYKLYGKDFIMDGDQSDVHNKLDFSNIGSASEEIDLIEYDYSQKDLITNDLFDLLRIEGGRKYAILPNKIHIPYDDMVLSTDDDTRLEEVKGLYSSYKSQLDNHVKRQFLFEMRDLLCSYGLFMSEKYDLFKRTLDNVVRYGKDLKKVGQWSLVPIFSTDDFELKRLTFTVRTNDGHCVEMSFHTDEFTTLKELVDSVVTYIKSELPRYYIQEPNLIQNTLDKLFKELNVEPIHVKITNAYIDVKASSLVGDASLILKFLIVSGELWVLTGKLDLGGREIRISNVSFASDVETSVDDWIISRIERINK